MAVSIPELAAECGFELAGVAPTLPPLHAEAYLDWVRRGLAGEMRYLTDHRADIRADPRQLLASARSIICVGKQYSGPEPLSTEFDDSGRAWISRYAWGDDYHDVVRAGLERLAARLRETREQDFEWRACVDTAPLLERGYARLAGLGWIGRNTCLINERRGSWFFLGELLTSLDLEPNAPPADRCGNCKRCIEACPTRAIVPNPTAPGGWELDSRLCISYFTIELRQEIPEERRPGIGRHVFGCDICQDVCPWNGRAAREGVNRPAAPEFRPRSFAPPLETLASLSEPQFRGMFRGSPVTRARYHGFLRNVAVAMGNSGEQSFLPALRKLAEYADPLVAGHARWAVERLRAAVSPAESRLNPPPP